MKNIGIITVYYTENTGSVLQATALKEYLESVHCNVYFINTKNRYSGHSITYLLKNIVKVLRVNAGCKQCISRFMYFEKYIKDTFNVINDSDVKTMKIDSIVIGSDTVWDVTSKYFIESKDAFWGIKYNDIPIISYAASIANSNYKELCELEYPKKTIKRIKCIGVRDEYTRNFVKSICDKNVELNCDPTMLFGLEYYKKKCRVIDDKYILLYLFEEIEQSIKNDLLTFARIRGLKIICLGKFITGCDIWISSNIENFLSYFNSAEFVLTNTFHGTVFSIIFNKKFVVLDFKKVKVHELLMKFGLTSRLTDNNLEIFEEEINYRVVNNLLDSYRESSKKYLLNALELK